MASEVFSDSDFSGMGLAGILEKHIHESLGFTRATRVQREAIPPFLAGRDLLVKADTGTGKTLAYLAPLVHLLQAQRKRVARAHGTYAVILAPTRELCLQIHELAVKLCRRFVWVVPGYAVGGESRAKEKARLRKGVNILVATPGRLLDHLRHTASFVTTPLQWVVLDEADRLLDLGFEKDLREILTLLGSTGGGGPGPGKGQGKGPSAANGGAPGRGRSGAAGGAGRVQTVLLSATLGPRVAALADLSLSDPHFVEVDGREGEKGKEKGKGRESGGKGESGDGRGKPEGVMDAVAGSKEGQGKREGKKRKGVVGLEGEDDAPGEGAGAKKAKASAGAAGLEASHAAAESRAARAAEAASGVPSAPGQGGHNDNDEDDDEDDDLPLFLQNLRSVAASEAGGGRRDAQVAPLRGQNGVAKAQNGGGVEEESASGSESDNESEDGDEDEGEDSPGGAKGAKGQTGRARGQAESADFDLPSRLTQTHLEVPYRLRLLALLAFLHARMGTARKTARKAHAHLHGPAVRLGPFLPREELAVVFLSTCDSVEFHHSLLSKCSNEETPPAAADTTSDPRQKPKPGVKHKPGAAAGWAAQPLGRPLLPPLSFFKLHGKMPQQERTKAFLAFRSMTQGVLLCTDVAARGLDFPHVPLVLQYDPPGDPIDYVHRVGRTARLGRQGEAVLFLAPHETAYLDELKRNNVGPREASLAECLEGLFTRHFPKKKVEHLRPNSENATAKRGVDTRHSGAFVEHPLCQNLQVALENLVAGDPELSASAPMAFRSFVRGYAVHKAELKQIFHPKMLHLGHVARSFALATVPSAVGLEQSSGRRGRGKVVQKGERKAPKTKVMRPAVMLE